MIAKNIKKCRICGNKSLKRILKLKKAPFTDQFLNHESVGKEFLEDIVAGICKTCGVTQKITFSFLNNYYSNYFYSVEESALASYFMKALAKKIKSNYFRDKVSPSVMEIGSGSGKQLQEFNLLNFKVLGVKPSGVLAKLANNRGVKTINSVFTRRMLRSLPKGFQKVDLVIASYTFDHLKSLSSLIKVCWNILHDKGLLIFGVHDLDLIVERSEFCLFEHEHFFYFNRRTLMNFLGQSKFDVLTFNLLREDEKRANSLLVVACKNDKKNFSQGKFSKRNRNDEEIAN